METEQVHIANNSILKGKSYAQFNISVHSLKKNAIESKNVLECDDLTYGKDCQYMCGNCFHGNVCHHVNGTCSNGCAAGYVGDKCQKGR